MRLWISDGAFYLKYLPEEPTPADTITISDIDADSGIEVELTATEDLVTKMKIKWRLSWTAVSDRPEDTNEQTIILRHNVAKYGLQEQDYDFYIYNQPDIVYKCGTFWMIRNSITWKRIKFKTFLNKLNLETFDAVTLDFASPYVANGPVLAVVEKASYSSADNLVDFQCLVPVAAGTMEKYKFYWPSALPTTDTWPTADEIAASQAGGGGIGSDATGNLPVGDTSTIPAGDVVFVGGPNVVFRGQSDWGDRTPTDVGFTPQTVVNPATYIDLSPGSRPYLDLRTYPRRSLPAITPIPPAASQITIDLNKTQILDTSDPTSNQDRLFVLDPPGRSPSPRTPDSNDSKLTISRSALVADSDKPDGPTTHRCLEVRRHLSVHPQRCLDLGQDGRGPPVRLPVRRHGPEVRGGNRVLARLSYGCNLRTDACRVERSAHADQQPRQESARRLQGPGRTAACHCAAQVERGRHYGSQEQAQRDLFQERLQRACNGRVDEVGHRRA